MAIYTDMDVYDKGREVFYISKKEGDALLAELAVLVKKLGKGYKRLHVRVYPSKRAVAYQGWTARVKWQAGQDTARITYQSPAEIDARKQAYRDFR